MVKKTDKTTIEPIPDTMENVAKKMVSPSAKKALTINKLPASLGQNPSTPNGQFDLFIDKQKEIDGVGMGD